MSKVQNIILSTMALVLFGCASEPETLPEIKEARKSVESVSNDSDVRRHASKHLLSAQRALDQAEQSEEEGENREVTKHYAYLANQHAKVAQEQATEETLRQKIEDAEARRSEILLSVRTTQAETATERAELSAAGALLATRNADRAEAKNKQLKQRLDSATAQVKEMESEIAGLKSKQTDRGLVLTLDEVLFETNKAELKPGAEKALNRLAQFLQKNDSSKLLIEGHTDSTGAAEYNRKLSSKRAKAVGDSLKNSGISEDRIKSKGLGEEYPIATNKTVAGRQENRRVEIIISN